MKKEEISSLVQKCGEQNATFIEDAKKRGAAGLVNMEAINQAAQWMQAQFLGEIAYQLAVMNDGSPFRTADGLCAAINQQLTPWAVCGLLEGHKGKHGWDRIPVVCRSL